MQQRINLNWRTTLSGILAILVVLATEMQYFSREFGFSVFSILAGLGLILAADAKKVKDKFGKLVLVLVVVSMSSCTKGSFDAFFKQLDAEIPLEQVNYKIAIPKRDTTLNWQSPYKIFLNKTQFKTDSIYHQEKFNFTGLGDFLWIEYQNWKAKRKVSNDTIPKPYPAPLYYNSFKPVFKPFDKKTYFLPYLNKTPQKMIVFRRARDGLEHRSMGVR